MKQSSRWFVIIAVAVMLITVLAGIKFFQIQAAIAFGKSFPEPSETVTAVTVVPVESSKSVTTIGEVVAPQAMELRNELEGKIAAVPAAAGARVKQGDVLLQLDVSEESAKLKAALARVELADLDLRRARKLYTQKTVSEEQVDKAQADYDIAQADAQALQALIDKKTLRAPFDAFIGLHSLEPGEYLQANSLIATLVGINSFVWIDFSLPLEQAVLTPGAMLDVWSERENRLLGQAVVIARDAAVSSSSRTLRFRARLQSETLPLPNAVVKLRVPLTESVEFVVPATAVLSDAMGDYVYLLDADSSGKGYRARRQGVSVSKVTEQQAMIREGLKAGDLVAAEGAFKLRNKLLTFVAASAEH